MPKFLDTTGKSSLGIALCARCSKKFPIGELRPDPNYPGLMVCKDDFDDYDPYRLAPRKPENIVLPFVRPDTNIDTDPEGLIGDSGDIFIIAEEDERFILP